MQKKLLLTLCFCWIFGLAQAQDEDIRTLSWDDVAQEGMNIGDFVPEGWTLEEQATGDLNKDGRIDAALQLVEDIAAEDENGAPTTRYRALVIIFRKKNGNGFELNTVGHYVLQCTTCGGMLTSVKTEIKNGVVIVDQLMGSREATNLTQRFRWESLFKRMMLIGEDRVDYDRANGDSKKVSKNLLTGNQVTETSKGGKKPTIVRKKIPKNMIPMDEINIYEGE
ncbi:MAG: hypothetical protein JNN12_02125 [Bacteroidetes Order II. Incertae sedis bacterium]|nr:hypothetical protein [Bacteroidetes Order II. bacterium]